MASCGVGSHLDGGLAFLVIAVTPGLKTAVAKEQVKPITDAFYQHYKKVAGVLLVVLLFTGGINLHYVNMSTRSSSRKLEVGSHIMRHTWSSSLSSSFSSSVF